MPSNTSVGFFANMRQKRRILVDLVVVISFVAICGSMVITIADILLRIAANAVEIASEVRPNWGIFGLVDLTQLAVLTAVPFAIAVAFFNGAHIQVDLLIEHLSKPFRLALGIFSGVLGLALMGFCFWTAYSEMHGQLEFTTNSATLGIPYSWYWAPLLAGFALCLIASATGLVFMATHREVGTPGMSDV